MRAIEIGVDRESVKVLDAVILQTQSVAELLQRSNDLQIEANELNLRAKRIMLDNARLLRSVARHPSIVVEDNGGT